MAADTQRECVALATLLCIWCTLGRGHDPKITSTWLLAKSQHCPYAIPNLIGGRMAERCNGFSLPANVTQAVGPDGDFTSRTIAAMGSKTQPRTKEIMTRLISHLHDFIRETGLTTDELMESIEVSPPRFVCEVPLAKIEQFLRWAVHVNDDKPYELFAACSILGVESYVGWTR